MFQKFADSNDLSGMRHGLFHETMSEDTYLNRVVCVYLSGELQPFVKLEDDSPDEEASNYISMGNEMSL